MPVHLTPMPTERVLPGAEVFPARRRRASHHVWLSAIGVVLTLQNCDKGSLPTHPDPDRLLAELPDIEIPSEPGSLGSLVGWALKQAPPALRYWELVNVEAALNSPERGQAGRPCSPDCLSGRIRFRALLTSLDGWKETPAPREWTGPTRRRVESTSSFGAGVKPSSRGSRSDMKVVCS